MPADKNPALIFEKSRKGRALEPVRADIPLVEIEKVLPAGILRSDIEGFPEIGELDCIRHYTELSTKNFGVENVFYPLGSCTMKYNPKVNEDAASLDGFTMAHPYEDASLTQGALEIMHSLELYLSEISGMDAVSLQPAAGAHGELCGLLVVCAYFRDRKENRKKILIPDTAHGTNPSSAALSGFTVARVGSGKRGILEADDVKKLMDEDTAALMLTNPNTLGLFEENIVEIADMVHEKGGFVYCDGANLNALMGIAKLARMGVDLVQFNLHKTFSTPHGGGGPGGGALGVKKTLEPYLPVPRVGKDGERYFLDFKREKTIGRMRAFYGNFLVMVKAYAYIRRMGSEGLRRASEMAVLNANYLKEALKGTYHLPFDRPCMHECVFTDRFQGEHGVITLDIAKRLMDYGFHPPTIYFPLVVGGAIMIEPTETESPETLDSFIAAMREIAEEAKTNPSLLKDAPLSTRTSRVREARSVKEPALRWRP